MILHADYGDDDDDDGETLSLSLPESHYRSRRFSIRTESAH